MSTNRTLKAYLNLPGVRQADLAACLGITQPTVSKIAHGKASITAPQAYDIWAASGEWIDINTLPMSPHARRVFDKVCEFRASLSERRPPSLISHKSGMDATPTCE